MLLALSTVHPCKQIHFASCSSPPFLLSTVSSYTQLALLLCTCTPCIYLLSLMFFFLSISLSTLIPYSLSLTSMGDLSSVSYPQPFLFPQSLGYSSLLYPISILSFCLLFILHLISFLSGLLIPATSTTRIPNLSLILIHCLSFLVQSCLFVAIFHCSSFFMLSFHLLLLTLLFLSFASMLILS